MWKSGTHIRHNDYDETVWAFRGLSQCKYCFKTLFLLLLIQKWTRKDNPLLRDLKFDQTCTVEKKCSWTWTSTTKTMDRTCIETFIGWQWRAWFCPILPHIFSWSFQTLFCMVHTYISRVPGSIPRHNALTSPSDRLSPWVALGRPGRRSLSCKDGGERMRVRWNLERIYSNVPTKEWWG